MNVPLYVDQNNEKPKKTKRKMKEKPKRKNACFKSKLVSKYVYKD